MKIEIAKTLNNNVASVLENTVEEMKVAGLISEDIDTGNFGAIDSMDIKSCKITHNENIINVEINDEFIIDILTTYSKVVVKLLPMATIVKSVFKSLKEIVKDTREELRFLDKKWETEFEYATAKIPNVCFGISIDCILKRIKGATKWSLLYIRYNPNSTINDEFVDDETMKGLYKTIRKSIEKNINDEKYTSLIEMASSYEESKEKVCNL